MQLGKIAVIAGGLLIVVATGAILAAVPAERGLSAPAGGVAIQMPVAGFRWAEDAPLIGSLLVTEDGAAVGVEGHTGSQTANDASAQEHDFVACRGL
jgi:hypothetical protein